MKDVVKLYEHGKLIFFKAKTPLHVGVGRTYGEAVDLPIQRDEHGVPVIWASSVKGALRASKYLAFKSESASKCLDYVYGPSEPSEESQFASCLSILDARLLFMPVRSLRGVYAYATSPLLLDYFRTYLDILVSCCKNVDNEIVKLYEASSNIVEELKSSISEAGVTDSSKSKLLTNNMLILNEYFIKNVTELSDRVRNFISTLSLKLFNSSELYDRIVILNDDIFMKIVSKSIIVINRVRLKYETKTVQTGPWSEEYVPRGTIFVSGILFSKPRFCMNGEECSKIRDRANRDCKVILAKRGNKCDDICSCDIWSIFIDPGKYMILGGHETIGKGIVEVIRI